MPSQENIFTASTPEALNHHQTNSPWRFCLAPMMEWSDKHCRYFWRLLSKEARLYTEMVTTPALIHGDRARFLAFNLEEHPIALQLGGSNAAELAECAHMAEAEGFNEVNLNCGCPSDRVQNNKIGACLMAEPALVAECFEAMQSRVSIPITVKHRIGIDDQDSESDLHTFVNTLYQAGCRIFIVHARKAWLQGLSPKENREVPPLDYDRVYRLKKAFPDATIVINGGLTEIAHCTEPLQHLDGVMVGRAAYHNPFLLAEVDNVLFSTPKEAKHIERNEILKDFIEYAWHQHSQGVRLHHMSRHILGLYAGQHGGKHFRRFLSENACKSDATPTVLEEALEGMIVHQQRALERASSQTPS